MAEIEAQRQLLALADAQASVVLPVEEPKIAYAAYTPDSRQLGGVIDSEYAILMDQESNTVLASLNGDKRLFRLHDKSDDVDRCRGAYAGVE